MLPWGAHVLQFLPHWLQPMWSCFSFGSPGFFRWAESWLHTCCHVFFYRASYASAVLAVVIAAGARSFAKMSLTIGLEWKDGRADDSMLCRLQCMVLVVAVKTAPTWTAGRRLLWRTGRRRRRRHRTYRWWAEWTHTGNGVKFTDACDRFLALEMFDAEFNVVTFSEDTCNTSKLLTSHACADCHIHILYEWWLQTHWWHIPSDLRCWISEWIVTSLLEHISASCYLECTVLWCPTADQQRSGRTLLVKRVWRP